MIRVAHIRREYLTRSETFIHTLLSHARAHRPHVFTDVSQNMEAFPIECTELVSAGEIATLRREGGRSVVQKFLSSLDFPASHELAIREGQYQVLHAHFGTDAYLALGLRRRLGLPMVTTFYGYDTSVPFKDPSFRDRVRTVFEESDRIIALGESMVNRLCQLGCSKEKIEIIRIGVDTTRIPFFAREQSDAVVILFCGRLVEKKGAIDTVEAFSHVARENSKAVLRIAGDGPLRRQVSGRIRDLGLTDRIHMLGMIPYDQLLEEFQSSDIFVLPSKTASNGDMEGTPTVILEAQASGLPIISTRHSGIPEVVREGHSADLVAEGSVHELAQSLSSLIEDPQRRRTMGLAGREYVEKHFTIGDRVSELERCYASLF